MPREGLLKINALLVQNVRSNLSFGFLLCSFFFNLKELKNKYTNEEIAKFQIIRFF